MRTLFYRLCRLLRVHQLVIFVFDGKQRPEIKRGKKVKKTLDIVLKYDAQKNPRISGVKRISKPGGRVHASSSQLPKVLGGMGIAILSTSSGMMTDREAKRAGVGGEVVAHVW